MVVAYSMLHDLPRAIKGNTKTAWIGGHGSRTEPASYLERSKNANHSTAMFGVYSYGTTNHQANSVLPQEKEWSWQCVICPSERKLQGSLTEVTTHLSKRLTNNADPETFIILRRPLMT